MLGKMDKEGKAIKSWAHVTYRSHFFFLAQHRLRSYAEFICKKNTLSNASIAKSREQYRVNNCRTSI